MSARKLAVQLLDRTEQEKSYSNLLLDHALAQSTLEERDKRLCASLYYGVIERRITLDAVLSHYCKQPLRKLDGTVRNIFAAGDLPAAVLRPDSGTCCGGCVGEADTFLPKGECIGFCKCRAAQLSAG